jgi:hypothetical protein
MPEVKGTRLSREADGLEPSYGFFIGRAEMRATALAEPLAAALQHETLGDRHGAKRRDICGREHARIGVGQQSRLIENQPGDFCEVVDRGAVAERLQFLARHRVSELRLVAEGEQRFLAAGHGPRARDAEHLVAREIGALAPPRRMREGAVVADVAAKPGQRDEHLPGVRHQRAVAGIA